MKTLINRIKEKTQDPMAGFVAAEVLFVVLLFIVLLVVAR